jgi:hypothetical protein
MLELPTTHISIPFFYRSFTKKQTIQTTQRAQSPCQECGVCLLSILPCLLLRVWGGLASISHLFFRILQNKHLIKTKIFIASAHCTHRLTSLLRIRQGEASTTSLALDSSSGSTSLPVQLDADTSLRSCSLHISTPSPSRAFSRTVLLRRDMSSYKSLHFAKLHNKNHRVQKLHQWHQKVMKSSKTTNDFICIILLRNTLI